MKRKGRLGQSFDALDQGVFGLHTDDAVHLFAVLEEHEHGDGAYAELSGELGAVVHVDLADFDGVALLSGELLKDGGQHAAGSAPFGPEIDDDRVGGRFDFGLKVVRCEGDECVAGHGIDALKLSSVDKGLRVSPSTGYFETDTAKGMVNERIISGRTRGAVWHGEG